MRWRVMKLLKVCILLFAVVILGVIGCSNDNSGETPLESSLNSDTTVWVKVFSDDFSDYDIGSFPDKNWIPSHGAYVELSNNYVCDTYSVSGKKSLQVVGQQGCGAHVNFYLGDTFPEKIRIITYMMSDRTDESKRDFAIGFWQTDYDLKVYSQSSTGYSNYLFLISGGIENDTSFKIRRQGDIILFNNLETYNYHKWYEIQLEFFKATKKLTVWIDGEQFGPYTLNISFNDSYKYNYFYLYTEDKAYFDDIEIYEAE